MSDTSLIPGVLRARWVTVLEDAEVLLRPTPDLFAFVKDEELVRLQVAISNARQRLREKKRDF